MTDRTPLRILIVSQYFWPERFRINDLALGLKARGHELSVVTGMPNYPDGRLFDGYRWWTKRYDDFDGIPVFRVPLFLRRKGEGWQLALNYLSFVVFGCLLAPWYFRRKAFDIIFVFEPSPFTVGIPAILMRRLKRAPMLFWVQDLWPESLEAAGAVRSPAILRLVGRMVRWIYRRCDRVLVQSRAFIAPVEASGGAPERICFFPNWAEDFYHPMSSKDASLPVNLSEGFRIMFAGNLGEAQSLETILDAAHRLRDEADICWLIIGEGRRERWMRERVAALRLENRVRFLGAWPADMMPRFFAHADALLATLKADKVFARTIPSKIQSYMACGKPVLAALDGEGAKVVDEADCGFVVPAGDGKALADAALRLSRLSGRERSAMGMRGRAYYEVHFDREMLMDRLEEWMVEVSKEGVCES